MAGDALKIPFFQQVQRATEHAIGSAQDLVGMVLPASVVTPMGGLVQIKFELTGIPQVLPNLTVPVAESAYVRLPLKAGDFGIVIPADTRIGHISGQGGTSADFTRPGNLGALTFLPIGNKSWAAPIDPQAVDISAPNGANIYDSNQSFIVKVGHNNVTIQKFDGSVSIVVDANKITSKVGAITTVLDNTGFHINGNAFINGGLQMSGNISAIGGGTYAGNFITSGTVQSGSIVLGTHKHTGVQTGGGTSGGPTP